jgi:hypothetical protein
MKQYELLVLIRLLITGTIYSQVLLEILSYYEDIFFYIRTCER